jgi:hypothetical protein
MRSPACAASGWEVATTFLAKTGVLIVRYGFVQSKGMGTPLRPLHKCFVFLSECQPQVFCKILPALRHHILLFYRLFLNFGRASAMWKEKTTRSSDYCWECFVF